MIFPLGTIPSFGFPLVPVEPVVAVVAVEPAVELDLLDPQPAARVSARSAVSTGTTLFIDGPFSTVSRSA